MYVANIQQLVNVQLIQNMSMNFLWFTFTYVLMRILSTVIIHFSPFFVLNGLAV